MARLRAAQPTNPMRRRLAAMVLVVVGIAGLGVASAAQLNASNGSLGAGTAVVASCQTSGSISVTFTTTWQTSLTPDAYGAIQVNLTNVNPACGGGAYRISILDAVGTALTEVTGPVPAAGGTVNSATFTAIAVTSISSVAVVIQK